MFVLVEGAHLYCLASTHPPRASPGPGLSRSKSDLYVCHGVGAGLLAGSGLHWTSRLLLPPSGFSGSETPGQFQRGSTDHLQYVDLLCRLGGFCTCLRQLTGEVCGGCGGLRHPGLQLRFTLLYLRSKMLYYPAETGEKQQEAFDV